MIQCHNTAVKLVVRYLLSEETRHKFHVPISLLDKGRMTRILECDPFRLLNLVEERLHHEVLRDVLPSVDNKRRYSNEVKTINNGPILHNPVMLILGSAAYIYIRSKNNTYGAAATVGSPSAPKTCSNG